MNAVLGRRVTRLEDRPLLTGRGRFVGDMVFEGQLYMRIARATCAHGRIAAMHLDAAKALPGVVALWTGDDIADLPPIDFRDPAATALAPYRQTILARERVRYIGEPVVAIFATDAYIAEDAAELIEIEYDEYPVTLDASGPLGEFAPGLQTEPIMLEQGYGDIAAAFARAHAVIELTLKIGRHSGVPLETRGAIGRYDAANDILELHGAAKVPHRNQEAMARFFGRDHAHLHLHEGHVGGGFGIRGELYPEDFLVCLAALRLGRPVKWIEDRREHLMAANHSREQEHHIRAAIDKDGVVLGLEDEFFHDQGAYIRTHGARVVDLTIGMLPGPYRIPAYRAKGHMRLTNKTPAATYRSPGRYEGSFVRERLMDAVAGRLGLDPIIVRQRNLVPKDAMPYARGLGALGTDVVLDSGDYAGLLDKALKRFDWRGRQAAIQARRTKGEYVGLGICMFVEKSGLGPKDGARIGVLPDGGIEIVTGSASLGQGVETALAQIAADTLGVDYRSIRVIHGQTDRIPYGIGAHASRATVLTGNATHQAAILLRETIMKAAADLLQLPVASLLIRDSIVSAREGGHGPSISLRDLAVQMPDALHSEGWFHTDHMTYPYGVHLAQVCLDAETCLTKVESYLVAYDVGRAVNPAMVEGQIAGGFAQGLGGALYEEFRYDERGEPLSVTFADYLIPTLHEVPALDILVTEDAPSPLNPLGIKGAGEGGCTGVGAAIASAVADALQKPEAVKTLPITPQRLRNMLRGPA
ncbi:xanthine dehydrogenase family protein molybdopterin-binding subunit [Ferrovibrio sp.]|uniref:xanthine dehydrogenase family protein molybdopterin-binding subunit n=1 Tax=Ferrovibrio sp. TaxID=1917215 RepID=UPI0035B45CA9